MSAVHPYVRFQKNPPEKMPPPKGTMDLYFDPTSGELVKQTADGTETEFSVSGHTHVSADITDTASIGSAGNVGKVVVFASYDSGERVGMTLGKVVLIGEATDPVLEFTGYDNGGTDTLRGSDSGSDYVQTLPAATGKLAITSQTDGSITEADLDIPAYADDSAAATGGVAVGDIYRKTDGTVVWRQS